MTSDSLTRNTTRVDTLKTMDEQRGVGMNLQPLYDTAESLLRGSKMQVSNLENLMNAPVLICGWTAGEGHAHVLPTAEFHLQRLVSSGSAGILKCGMWEDGFPSPQMKYSVESAEVDKNV